MVIEFLESRICHKCNRIHGQEELFLKVIPVGKRLNLESN
jgi:hypothetical protein